MRDDQRGKLEPERIEGVTDERGDDQPGHAEAFDDVAKRRAVAGMAELAAMDGRMQRIDGKRAAQAGLEQFENARALGALFVAACDEQQVVEAVRSAREVVHEALDAAAPTMHQMQQDGTPIEPRMTMASERTRQGSAEASDERVIPQGAGRTVACSEQAVEEQIGPFVAASSGPPGKCRRYASGGDELPSAQTPTAGIEGRQARLQGFGRERGKLAQPRVERAERSLSEARSLLETRDPVLRQPRIRSDHEQGQRPVAAVGEEGLQRVGPARGARDPNGAWRSAALGTGEKELLAGQDRGELGEPFRLRRSFAPEAEDHGGRFAS